jgi:regulator of protease activity HflC (stomatin/prohibitin superfamily)
MPAVNPPFAPPAFWRAARWAVLGIFALILLAVLPRSCTRVETGEVGLRKTFTGTVEMAPLGPGFHQSIVGQVLIFSAREVLVPVKDLHPVTADKLPMEDVDVQLTYKVSPGSIPALYTRYSASYHVLGDREIFVMQRFIEQFVRSAVADAIAKYPALQVNDRRAEIVGEIQDDVNGKIKREGLEKDLTVGQIVFTTVQIPRVIVESTAAVVKAQNEAKAAEFTANVARVSAQGQADAAVIQAKGAAEAVKQQATAIQIQGGEAYLRLEAIRKWNGVMPVYMSPHQPLPFIDTAVGGK